MNKQERKIYDTILSFLNQRELEMDVDSFSLEVLAKAFAAYNNTSEVISKMDFTKQDKGFSQTNTWLIYKQAIDTIYKFGDKFGLNPTAREKIKAFAKKEEKEDPMEKI